MAAAAPGNDELQAIEQAAAAAMKRRRASSSSDFPAASHLAPGAEREANRDKMEESLLHGCGMKCGDRDEIADFGRSRTTWRCLRGHRVHPFRTVSRPPPCSRPAPGVPPLPSISGNPTLAVALAGRNGTGMASRRVKGAWWSLRSSKPTPVRSAGRGRFDSCPLRPFFRPHSLMSK